MPNLLYLLFLVTLVIIGWNFPTVTALPVSDTGAINSSSVETQEEYREGRDARAREVLLWMKDNLRMVENLSGPVKEYCFQAKLVRDLMKMYPKPDPVNDSDIIRIREDTVAVCERILDLCELPAIVQPVEPQISILHQILAHPYKILMAVGYIIGWYFNITDAVEAMATFALPTFRQMTFLVIEWIIVAPIVFILLYKAFDMNVRMFMVTAILSEETTFPWLIVRKILFCVSWMCVMSLLRHIFKVERSEKEVLEEFDQILQRLNTTQIDVVNLLAAGASRNQLRASEREAEIEREKLRMLKSIVDSSRGFFFKLKYRFDKIAAKMEDIVDVAERILYLCRPMAAA